MFAERSTCKALMTQPGAKAGEGETEDFYDLIWS